ncbi:Nuclear envelope morphology protein 1 [Lithohypha guttulata]|uniref:Nuclear envelope morphology protein 1 n=1 Tax=Lithohypha guttulata TaxID=1690604 RepID=UPI002DE0C811|nr:Nuclear envelope morphology protein 1 [Lithohypha guttulata]
MNSLNLLSAKVIGQPVARSRAKSQSEDLRRKLSGELVRGRSHSAQQAPEVKSGDASELDEPIIKAGSDDAETPGIEPGDEKQLLLNHEKRREESGFGSKLHSIVKRIADAITAILATIGMPVVYVAKCFRDESGQYSALVPFKRKRRKLTTKDVSKPKPDELPEKPYDRITRETKLKHSYSSDSLSSMNSLQTDSDSDNKRRKERKAKKVEKLDVDDGGHRRRSSRIRLLQHEDVTQRRKSRLADSATTPDGGPLTVDNIKSPMSVATANKLRYPHAPQPPRPLIPRRQPSYSNVAAQLSTHAHRRLSYTPHIHQKTLILDLDETLIHSFAKGGRMSSGHMVEVKLNSPVYNPVAQAVPGQPAPPQQIIGPQHPILYYVHKRPHCDEFLKKVAKWYKVVIFTASVQEYADPVIDWLEQEKKFFAGRYYRQHCTFRNGSYIKDLSSIEPDLSKVIILDNSPVSYVFHEDNAIPIEGWINDPTDNDLLHLIPLFEALQYVTDVRALLALRRGEADTGVTTSAAA